MILLKYFKINRKCRKSLYILDYFFVVIVLVYICYIYFRLEKKVFMFKKENDFFYFVFLLSR